MHHMFMPFFFHTLAFFSPSIFRIRSAAVFRRFLRLVGGIGGPTSLWDGLAPYYYGWMIGARSLVYTLCFAWTWDFADMIEMSLAG
jgi:hypothetical protein